MIKCSICSTLNDEFAVVCTSCHGYLQERVPNLDFFSTFWKLIESPRQAFRHIIISEHKNYIIVLNLIMGPMLMFGMMWAWKTGEYFDNLLFLMLLGIVAGVMISPVYFLVSNALVFGIMRLFRGEGTWRNTMAVLAWSHSPFMFAFLIVLPIQLAVLGLPLFSRNPSGYEIKPLAFAAMMGLDIGIIVWFFFLVIIGLSLLHRMHAMKTGILIVFVYAAVIVGISTAYALILS